MEAQGGCHEIDVVNFTAGPWTGTGNDGRPGPELAYQTAARDRARRSGQHHRYHPTRGVRAAVGATRPEHCGGEPCWRRGQTGSGFVAKADPDGYTLLAHRSASPSRRRSIPTSATIQRAISLRSSRSASRRRFWSFRRRGDGGLSPISSPRPKASRGRSTSPRSVCGPQRT